MIVWWVWIINKYSLPEDLNKIQPSSVSDTRSSKLSIEKLPANIKRYPFLQNKSGDYYTIIPELWIDITIPYESLTNCYDGTDRRSDECVQKTRGEDLSWWVLVSWNTIVLGRAYDIWKKFEDDKESQWFDSIMSINMYQKDINKSLASLLQSTWCVLKYYDWDNSVPKLWYPWVTTYNMHWNEDTTDSMNDIYDRCGLSIYLYSDKYPDRYISAAYAFQDEYLLNSFAIITYTK